MSEVDEQSSNRADDQNSETGWKYYAWLVAAGFSVLMIVTSLLPLLPVNWWWVRIGDFPRLQLLIGHLIALGLLAFFLTKRRSQVLAGLLVMGVGIQLYWIFPYLAVFPQEVEASRSNEPENLIRILSCNVLQENTNSSDLRALIERIDADVVVLCEVNQRWLSDLNSVVSKYRHTVERPMDNGYGIAMYSNLELLGSEIHTLVSDEIPSIDARVRLRNGQEVRIFAVHPNPPRPGESTRKRDAELVLVGREVRDDSTAIVLGDLNDVGWSRTTNLFQEVSGLLDPRKGRGFYSTYNAQSAIWRYPLDYCFHSDDFRLAEMRILESIGSDHFPLLVELSHEPSAKDDQEAPDLDAGDQEDAQEAVEKVKGK